MRAIAESSLIQRLLVGGVRAYRLLLSPWLGSACRFEPTCSAYAIEALDVHGTTRGLWLTVRRLLRCRPFGPSGWDPVPEPSPDRSSSRAIARTSPKGSPA